MDGKEDKQIYTPPAPSNEVYSDEELQSIVEGSTWVHLRAMAYEVLLHRAVERSYEAEHQIMKDDIRHWRDATIWWTDTAHRKHRERDEAREWAIKLYQDNRRLLSRVGELEVELEETRIERDNWKKDFDDTDSERGGYWQLLYDFYNGIYTAEFFREVVSKELFNGHP